MTGMLPSSIEKKQKNNFTLLEICIAIFLISLCGTIVGIKVNSFFQAEKISRLRHGFEFFIGDCKKRARLRQADVILILTQRKEGLELLVTSDEKEVEKREELYFFKGCNFTFGKESKQAVVCFSRGGVVFPKKNLIFFSGKRKILHFRPGGILDERIAVFLSPEIKR